MKNRKLPPTKPSAIPFKAVYKVKHFIRVYLDHRHPEIYKDTEVRTRTARPTLLDNLYADAYQFYDALEVTYLGVPIEPTLTEPRNFSCYKAVKNDEYEED